MKAGYIHAVDADLTQFFDTIPHAELLRSIARRVSDGAMLHLIKMWLKAPVEERSDKGKRTRRKPGNRGTPQGAVLSPLLANIYMRRFLKAWEKRGNDKKFDCRVINYTDDFVILCRRNADQALKEARYIFSLIGLTLNDEKTRVCQVWKEPFDFLGYSFGVQYFFGSGRKYQAAFPSTKSVQHLKTKLRRMVGNHMSWQNAENLTRDVNRMMRGWMNYFSYGSLWKTYAKVERFLQSRIRGWLVHKHRIGCRGECRFPAKYIYDTLGVVCPTRVISPSRKP